MNLYKLYTNPEQLAHYDERFKIPKFAWDKMVAISPRPGFEKYAEYFKTEAQMATNYAKHFKRSRWPEAEPYIKQDATIWDQYEKQFGI